MSFKISINYPFFRSEDYDVLSKSDLGKDFVEYYRGESISEQYDAFIQNVDVIQEVFISELSPKNQFHFFFC